MNELSVISDATTIANNLSSMIVNLDTRTVRKASNKLGYSIQTIGNARQLVNLLDLDDRDHQRAEALIDAFTMVARDDILKTLR